MNLLPYGIYGRTSTSDLQMIFSSLTWGNFSLQVSVNMPESALCIPYAPEKLYLNQSLAKKAT